MCSTHSLGKVDDSPACSKACHQAILWGPSLMMVSLEPQAAERKHLQNDQSYIIIIYYNIYICIRLPNLQNWLYTVYFHFFIQRVAKAMGLEAHRHQERELPIESHSRGAGGLCHTYSLCQAGRGHMPHPLCQKTNQSAMWREEAHATPTVPRLWIYTYSYDYRLYTFICVATWRSTRL